MDTRVFGNRNRRVRDSHHSTLPQGTRTFFGGLLVVLSLIACQEHKATSFQDFYSSEFFHAVQVSAVFPDSKTFVDCTPKRDPGEIINAYDQMKESPDFDLASFVRSNFDLPVRPTSTFTTDTTQPMKAHIDRIWPILTRQPDERHERSSLVPLPHPYIVPGGRFSEIYYWDSYFTMTGLAAEGRFDMIRNMVDNFAFLIDSLGHIPNGNRAYYLSRSQPPFFSLMVNLLEQHDSTLLLHYLPQLEEEYDFWMNGADGLKLPGDAFRRVVMMPDGSILNRYWDDLATPRPEAYKEDFALQQASGRDPDDIYRNLRAAAESGWDFCTRWFADGKSLSTIHTTDMVAVDLNALLFNLEQTLARAYQAQGRHPDKTKLQHAADQRKERIRKFLWDPARTFYTDYNFVSGELSPALSLAGLYPFFTRIADDGQATGAAQVVEEGFLQPGGLTATLMVTGQQWDAPNGWAPLEWIAYTGMMNYGKKALAASIRTRWLSLNRKVYRATGKMEEKYNVMDTTLRAGGGEYPNQDGFGWTNGVAVALMAEHLP